MENTMFRTLAQIFGPGLFCVLFLWLILTWAQGAAAHPFSGVMAKPGIEAYDLAIPDQVGPEGRAVTTLTGHVPDLQAPLPEATFLPAIVLYPDLGQVCGCVRDPRIGWQCACDPAPVPLECGE